MPKENRLRKPKEFRLVYAEGKRFDGKYMSAFIIPNQSRHRIGITASKKAIGNAVQRNRAKRLLRETFRLNKQELNELNGKYDWVLNARRNLLFVKLEKPLQDFQQIIEKVKNSELEIAKGEQDAV